MKIKVKMDVLSPSLHENISGWDNYFSELLRPLRKFFPSYIMQQLF